MEVEISMKIIIDGGTPVEYNYTIEDGQDKDFCDLIQEARKKLSHKMKYYVENNCK